MTTETTTPDQPDASTALPPEHPTSGIIFAESRWVDIDPMAMAGLPADQLALWKEELLPGEFWSNDRSGRRISWKVKPDDIKDAHDCGKKALSLGFKPLIQDRHWGKPERVYGKIADVRINDRGGLETLHTFASVKDRDDAVKQHTSIFLEPNKELADHSKWKWWLGHSAVVHDPQLKFLRDYQPALAASAGPAVDVAVLMRADANTGAPPQKEVHMDPTNPLRALLGDKAEGKPDDQLPALALAAYTEVKTNYEQQKGINISLSEQIGEVQAERDNALALAGEPADAPEMDPRLKAMLGDAADQARELALSAGITPAQAKLFDELFDDAGGNPNALALSAVGPSNKTLEFEFWRRLAQLGDGFIKTQNGVPRGAPVKPLALSGEPTDPNTASPAPERLNELRRLANLPTK